MSKKKEELQKLDVRIISSKFIKGDFGIYEVALLNAKEVMNDPIIDQFNSTFVTVIKGNFERQFQMDEEFYMFGTSVVHPQFGHQFNVQFVKNKSDTPTAVKKFLTEFCQESIVDQLIEKYGNDVIQVILDDTLDYSDIKGMGDVRYNSLREKVVENEYMQGLITELGDFGLTPNQMKRVAKLFGASAVSKIKENPYLLCKVHGIGFMRADEIAKKMGFDPLSPFRIREAIKYIVEQNGMDGHTWILQKNVLGKARELLKITDMKLVSAEIEHTEDITIVDGDKVALQKVYDQEMLVATRLKEIQANSTELKFDIIKFLGEWEEKYNVKFTHEQRAFFMSLMKSNVNYLVGYAGCGKSFVQEVAKEIFKILGIKFKFLAPTGKASKVLSEYIGEEAFTIHRALKWTGDSDDVIKLHDPAVSVDESSMSDIPIMATLLDSLVNPEVRVVFVGDDFQIPSVGAGNFLYDCITSGIFPTTKLTKVFRQAEGGALDIITKIRLGEKFIDDTDSGKLSFGDDCVIHLTPQKFMGDGVKYYYKEALREGFSVDDIIVLTPTKKGELGTNKINQSIQAIVNPAKDGKAEYAYGFDIIFREGDRVINIKNSYKLFDIDTPEELRTTENEVTVVNGDIGVIEKINTKDQKFIINYGFARIEYAFVNFDLIVHAYALTIHKSQGSGFKYTIVVADKAHKWQMNANLLYTGATRMKQQLRMLTQPDVINSAMEKNISLQRNTFLPKFLKNRLTSVK